ncbi:GAF and ANTAR domain-containing protein [Terrabacter sp. Soil811]|uniref:GAF and ANTAR domain-containing protein n=1 Tax=Terrabacter sp. Soil811 TaxID=1736419 RepID=UPI0009EB6548|nr:GAF and ANTAR domain-containing protein [Terrabacter sp. Soil811]
MGGTSSARRIDNDLGDLRIVAEAFADLGSRLAQLQPLDPFEAITAVAREQFPRAAGASVTTLRHHHFVTVAATDDRTRRADSIQYELGSGPCLDAIVARTMYRPRDLRTDERWPAYGRRVADELGLDSMLSYRLVLPADDTVAGLNLYAEQPDAFTDHDALLGLLLATHGVQVATAMFYGHQVQHLKRALKTNRRIGVAMGVLMATHKVTDEQAFDLLRIASQNSNRKIAEIADDVVETGCLDVTAYLPHGSRRRPSPSAAPQALPPSHTPPMSRPGPP